VKSVLDVLWWPECAVVVCVCCGGLRSVICLWSCLQVCGEDSSIPIWMRIREYTSVARIVGLVD
jgi:hypothetical protein